MGKILRATGLKDEDWIGQSDPFVTVKLGTESMTTTRMNDNHNPVWNQDRTFREVKTIDDWKITTVGYTVLDYDSLKTNDNLGKGSRTPCANLMPGKICSQTLTLHG